MSVPNAAPPQERKRRKRGDGEGSIRYSEKRRLWMAEIMVGLKADGSRDMRYVAAKTRKECQAKLDAIRQRAGDGMLGDADKERATLGAFLDQWIGATKATVRPATHTRYEQIVRVHLKPGLGRHKLSGLKVDHVQTFYADKLDTGLSAQTVVHLHRVLHRALGQAARWGYVPRNVVAVASPPTVKRTEIKPPTPGEIVALLDAAEDAGDRLVALWALAAYTGARQGELLALKWSDVDLDGGTMRIDRSLVSVAKGAPTFGEPKTAKSRRTVVLVPEAVETLKAHRDRQAFERQRLGDAYPAYDLVYTTKFGTALDKVNVGKLFKAAMKRAELRNGVRFHDLRHAAITMMLLAGVPVTAVSETVGHHSAAMTLGRYGHLLPGAKQQAAEKLGEALRKARATAS